MLFKEIIVVYYDNHMKHTNTRCGQKAESVNVKTRNTCRYNCAFKELKANFLKSKAIMA
jgi:hypothetical protein